MRAGLRAIPLELRQVAAVLGIALVLGASFVAAYTVALGRPVPRHLPIGVVGEASPRLLAELERHSHELEPRRYRDRAAAVEAVDQQTITAVIDTTAAPPELLISSASDPSTARVLTQIDQAATGQPALKIVDLHPLPAEDPAGLATFYLTIAATILGFVTMFQLRANVKTLDHPDMAGVHPAGQHLLRRRGVGDAAAATLLVSQPRAAQWRRRFGDPFGDVLPGSPAARPLPGARRLAGGLAARARGGLTPATALPGSGMIARRAGIRGAWTGNVRSSAVALRG